MNISAGLDSESNVLKVRNNNILLEANIQEVEPKENLITIYKHVMN